MNAPACRDCPVRDTTECNVDECQYARKQLIARRRGNTTKIKHSRPSRKVRGRHCSLCGKDPYPNYFFCPRCRIKLGINYFTYVTKGYHADISQYR
jgi:hypothetical protein